MKPFKIVMILFTMLFMIGSTGFDPVVVAEEPNGEPGRDSGKPNPLRNAYFGGRHLHMQNSPDAFAIGTRNTPNHVFNLAKGLSVQTHAGQQPREGVRQDALRPGGSISG
jgi:hypothetical protein